MTINHRHYFFVVVVLFLEGIKKERTRLTDAEGTREAAREAPVGSRHFLRESRQQPEDRSGARVAGTR